MAFNIDIFKAIESIVSKHSMSYIEAIVYYCEKNDVDFDSIAAVIKSSPKILASVEIEAEDLNFIKKTVSRLPV